MKSFQKIIEALQNINDPKKEFNVIVSVPNKSKDISYPPKGYPLFTKKEAAEFIRTLIKKNPKADIWAESPTERFDILDL